MPSQETRPDPRLYIPCPLRSQQRLHPVAAVLIYGILLGLFGLLVIGQRLPDSLMILFAVPVVVALLFGYGRAVYLPMAALLVACSIWVTSILSHNFRASLFTICFSAVSVVAMAEMVNWLIQLRQRAEAALRASEEQYRLLFQHSPVGILHYDSQLRITGCNQRLAEIVRSRREQLIGFDMHEMRDSSVVPCLSSAVEGQEASYEGPYYSQADLPAVWISLRAAPLLDQAGLLKGGIAIVEDITGYKLARQALQAAEHEKETILDSLREHVIYQDLEQKILWVNRAVVETGGTLREELVGQHCYRVWHQREAPCPSCPVLIAMQTGSSSAAEIPTPDGRQWFIRGYPVRDPEGRITGSIKLAEDITERKQTGERLAHLNAVLRAVRNVNQLITRERDRARLIQGACESLVETRGYYYAWIVLADRAGTPATVAEAGVEPGLLARQLDRNQTPHCIEQALANPGLLTIRGEQAICGRCLLHPSSQEAGTLAIRLEYEGEVYGTLSVSLPVHLAADPAEQELFQEVAGDLAFALYSVEQQEKRREAEAALLWEARVNATMAELSETFLTSPSIEDISALVLEDALRLTKSPTGFVGYIDQVTGHLVCPTMSGEVWEACQVEGKSIHFHEFRGLWGWVLDRQQPILTNDPAHDPRSTGVPAGHVAIHRFLGVPVLAGGRLVGQIALANARTEYSERELAVVQRLADIYAIAIQHRRLEEQLLQSQKMEAIGRLAGGIAHDFNNHLTAINGYTALIADELRDDDPLRADLSEIQRAAERSTLLTRQLLAFSRKQILEPQVLDLNHVVVNMENMLQRVIGEDIQLRLELSPELAGVRADQGQIDQVIVNLVVNSRDALPNGGHITIHTANVRWDEIRPPHRLLVPPGTYVSLSIIDDGFGMDTEIQAHLFEPFFTTKAEGKGTGLGLATAYGIIQQSGGLIFVDSKPKHGSTFTIYLPRIEETPLSSHQQPADGSLLQGSETILLVEDEGAVRMLAQRVLRRQGYTVLEAQDAAEALDRSMRYQGTIHLTITDVIMPGGMNGRALAERLLQQRPDMKVLYMSGYNDDAIAHHGVLDEGTHFIQKPFTGDVLARQVRFVLDSDLTKPGFPV